MKRLVVRFCEEFVNIQAERIEENNGMIFAFAENTLVGVFDLGAINMIYLS